MRSVCVFCGSSPGANPAYADDARRLGTILARRKIVLVYGGGNVGLMGILADAALVAGGQVIGVIPRSLLDLEVGHTGLPDLRVVESMHQRKAMMADLADAFIALPGGIGTLEELCEIVTWAQLGMHSKPCGLVDTDGYYELLLKFLDQAVQARFLRPEHRALLMRDRDPEALLERMQRYEPPILEKWIDRETT
jgi:uncharacterized protein (TIGR00730 family)